MKIVLPGGSGQVGTVLARHFHARGHDVVVLSRHPRASAWRAVEWDARTLGGWASEIDGADVVINLAGRSVDCRYTSANRRLILDSRVDSTRVLGEAIAKSDQPPKTWLQSSTATIYSHSFDTANDELHGVIGGNEPNAPETWKFSIEVAKAWEYAANEAETPHTRKVLMRSAMIMSPDKGGVFDALLRLVRFRLGGRCGDGKQYVSWIHEHDFLAAVEYLIVKEQLTGAVNLASPNPLPQAEFMRCLRVAWGTRIGLPASKWMIEIGAFMIRTESELILKSRRVVPGRLLQTGFEFQYSEWPAAATELCQRVRST